jgi:hypothetical protein
VFETYQSDTWFYLHTTRFHGCRPKKKKRGGNTGMVTS